MEKWHVYQLRGDTGLLYVGYTRRRLSHRLSEHRRQKPWWPEVTEVRSEEFATEDEARQREKEIWTVAQPKYNKHNPFRTADEYHQYWRGHNRSPKVRERNRARDKTPERREQNRKTGAARTRRYRARRWQQPGPGLF
jgi:predicted GIY-YIG superfamily endonuclease